MTDKEYEVVLTPQDEGGYTVSVPELPDVATEGETREEALEMAREAIQAYLETMAEHDWPVPSSERAQVVIQQA